MNAGEVAELAAAGVDFQLHTHRHRSPDESELYRRELRENRDSIRAKTGSGAVHFCYPSGVYKPEHLPSLQAEGVVSATTCDPGFATQATDPLLLPRLVDHTGLSPIEFEGWLSGPASLLPQKRYDAGSS
jgi:peptidoglycan/xylan/chitin deacetylase (PgdA/CDA1 family)